MRPNFFYVCVCVFLDVCVCAIKVCMRIFILEVCMRLKILAYVFFIICCMCMPRYIFTNMCMCYILIEMY